MNTALRNTPVSYHNRCQLPASSSRYSVWDCAVRNKKRRERQIRRNIALLTAFVTLTLTLTLSIVFGSFLSNAKSGTEDISYKYYQSILVQPGDTLWSIAETHFDSHYDDKTDYVNEVMHINSLADDSSLTAGEYLIIPYYSSEFVS